METTAWVRVGASAMVRARSNSSNAMWLTVSGLPIFDIVPHMYWAPLCTVSLPCVCTVTRSCYSAFVVYRTTYPCASLCGSSTACSILYHGVYFVEVLFTPILCWCSRVPATILTSANIDPRALSCCGRYNMIMYDSLYQRVRSGCRRFPIWYLCPVGSVTPWITRLAAAATLQAGQW